MISKNKGKKTSTKNQGRDLNEISLLDENLDLISEPAWAFKAIYEEALNGIVLLDGTTGLIIATNPAAEKLLGHGREFLRGKQISMLFPPSLKSTNDFLKHLRVHGTVFESQCFLRSDKKTSFLDVTAKLLFSNGKQLVFVTLQDASERMESEKRVLVLNEQLEERIKERTEELEILNKNLLEQIKALKSAKKSIELFQKAIDHTQSGILICEVKKNQKPVIYINRAFTLITGFSLEESVGREFDFFTESPDNPLEAERLRVALSENNECRVILTHRRHEQPFWVDLIVSPLRDERGEATHLVGVLNDISERKRAEEETSRALQQEKSLNELKSNFVSMVSHEFRTPLGIIMSSAGILESYDEKVSFAERIEYLRDIKLAVKRMAHLMEDVLWLGKMEMGKLHYQASQIDLLEVCQSVIQQSELAFQISSRIQFSTDIPKLDPVYLDETLLRLVLVNLLSNALKYSPEKSPVRFLLTKDENRFCFKIIDEGIGIPEQNQSQIFEPFQRGNNVGQTPGSGLGLLIVKKCVELQGGSIRFQSEKNKGTTFEVYLPFHSVSSIDVCS